MAKKPNKIDKLGSDSSSGMEAVIYIGPSIQSLGISNRGCYIGGMPSGSDKLFELVPMAQVLFVSKTEFAAALLQLKNKTSVETVAYSKILELQNKGIR